MWISRACTSFSFCEEEPTTFAFENDFKERTSKKREEKRGKKIRHLHSARLFLDTRALEEIERDREGGERDGRDDDDDDDDDDENNVSHHCRRGVLSSFRFLSSSSPLLFRAVFVFFTHFPAFDACVRSLEEARV